MISRLVVSGMLALTALGAQAGGVGGSIVFDPSNFSKNAVTAAEAARQTTEQVKANLTHLQQLSELVAARRPLSPADLALTGNATSLPEISKRIDAVQSLANSLDTLSRDIGGERTRFNARFNAAQALGLTLSDYYDQVKAQADRGVKHVQAGIEADRKSLQAVSASYGQVTQWADTLKGIDSQVAGLSLLGSQMNLLVAQNAELMAFMVRTNHARHQEQIKAERQAQRVADEDLKIEAASRQLYRQSRDSLMSGLKAKGSDAGAGDPDPTRSGPLSK